MKTRFLVIVLGLLLAWQASALSTGPQVIFIDGGVDFKTATDWKPLQIGDILSPDSQIRLANGAKLEISVNGGVVAIFHPGVYTLSTVVKQRGNSSAREIGNLISRRLAKIAGGDNQKASQGGVRGSPQQVSLQKSASEEYNASMEAGLAAVQIGKADIAFNHFRDALDMGIAGMQIQAAVYAAQSALVMGKAAQAMECLEGLEPQADDPFGPVFYLSRGQALLQGAELAAAQADFNHVVKTPAATADLRQEALVGLGICAQAQGDLANAKKIWKDAVALDPKSDSGVNAAKLINQ